ncbi:MAG: hypothetical protein AAF602_26925 [Myxococcota bacterium]
MFVVLVLGCLLHDPDDRCSPGQRFEDGACVCLPGYDPEPGAGCIEVLPPSEGRGVACDPADSGCTGAYPFCQPVDGFDGYCTTTGCTVNGDCEGSYACNTTAQPSFCERPPLGHGEPCETSDDCAEFEEATYCESQFGNVCLVGGCALGGDDCFSGFACCDLSSVGIPELVCVPEDQCIN